MHLGVKTPPSSPKKSKLSPAHAFLIFVGVVPLLQWGFTVEVRVYSMSCIDDGFVSPADSSTPSIGVFVEESWIGFSVVLSRRPLAAPVWPNAFLAGRLDVDKRFDLGLLFDWTRTRQRGKQGINCVRDRDDSPFHTRHTLIHTYT